MARASTRWRLSGAALATIGLKLLNGFDVAIFGDNLAANFDMTPRVPTSARGFYLAR